jgi:hypothetical protein
MHKKPKYELLEALTNAAKGAYQLLDGRYNPDVVFWETLEVNRINDPGGFIVGIINELGYEQYQKIREIIMGKSKERLIIDQNR